MYRANVHLFCTGGVQFPSLVGVVENQPGGSKSIMGLPSPPNGQTHEGSISPLRVAPGNPAKGVKPILRPC